MVLASFVPKRGKTVRNEKFFHLKKKKRKQKRKKKLDFNPETEITKSDWETIEIKILAADKVEMFEKGLEITMRDSGKKILQSRKEK